MRHIWNKLKNKLLIGVLAIGSAIGVASTSVTSINAEVDTGNYTLNWYQNGDWLEGWSTWTYGAGLPTSTDWIWLEKTAIDGNGTVTFRPYAGWSSSNGNWWQYGGWKYTYHFYVNNNEVAQVPAPPAGTNLAYAFNGTLVERVSGQTFQIGQGTSFTLYFEVRNGVNTTVSRGSININVPIYKIPEHQLAFDTQGGHIPLYDNDKEYVIPDSGYYYLQAAKVDTNKYLNVVDASKQEQAGVILYQDAGTPQTRWYLERYNDTQYYTIQNDNASMYLSGGQAGSTESMQQARIKYQKTLSGNVITGNISKEELADNQLWFFTQNSDGSIAIHNKQNPDQVLDMLGYSWENGTPVGFYPFNGADNQKWNLVKCGGNGDYATKKKRLNQYQFIPTVKPERDGYKFLNWNTEKDGTGTKYEAGQNYTHDQDGGTVTLYAQWERAEYTVTYKGNGGSYNGTDQWSNKAIFGNDYVTKENMFERIGYEFAGWNTEADGSGDDWTKNIGVPIKWTLEENLTLYAQWKPITYTIVYNGNGHTSGSMKDQTLTYDKEETLYKNQYKKDNADFIEWNTKPDGTGTKFKDQQKVKNLTTKKGETITLYAIWDNVPTLTTKDDAYKKGTTISIGKIIKDNATATDVEDGNLDDEIKIEKIIYPDGSIKENPSKESNLNTNWDNNKKITIIYKVSDSYGHTVTKTNKITILNPKPLPPTDPDPSGTNPSIYNRYIDQGYEWSLNSDSIWEQNSEYKNELNDVLNNLR